MLLNDEPPRKTPRLGIASLLSPAPSSELALPTSGSAVSNPQRPGSSSSTASQPHPLRSSFTDPASDTEQVSVLSSPSPTLSPARAHLSVSQPSSVLPPKPSFTPPRLPYNPRRITPAGSVLRPLTQAELSTWVSQNPLRHIDRPGQKPNGSIDEKTSPLGKRTRDSSDENIQPPAKRSKDSKMVAQHCKLDVRL